MARDSVRDGNNGVVEGYQRMAEMDGHAKTNNKGGFWVSVLLMSSTVMGAGFLTLPKIAVTNGLLSMVGMVLLSNLVNFIANLQIARGFCATREKTYPGIIKELTSPFYGKFCGAVLVIYVYTVTMVLLVFSAGFFMEFLVYSGLRSNSHSEESNRQMELFVLIAMYIICFLCAIGKKLSSLRYIGIVVMGISLIVSFVIIYLMPRIREHYIEKGATFIDFKLDYHLFGAFCQCFFITMNQFSVTNIMNDFKQPSVKRVYLLIALSTMFPIIIHLVASIGGYLSCGDQCPDFFLNREVSEKDTDNLMMLSKMFMMLCFVLGVVFRNQINQEYLISACEGAGSNSILTRIRRIYNSRIQNDNNQPSPDTHAIENNHKPEKTLQQQKELPENENTIKIPEQIKSNKNEPQPIRVEGTRKNPLNKFETFFLCFINASIPGLGAILIRKDLLNSIKIAFGFFAPILVIIFPCVITFSLHKKGAFPISPISAVPCWAWPVIPVVVIDGNLFSLWGVSWSGLPLP